MRAGLVAEPECEVSGTTTGDSTGTTGSSGTTTGGTTGSSGTTTTGGSTTGTGTGTTGGTTGGSSQVTTIPTVSFAMDAKDCSFAWVVAVVALLVTAFLALVSVSSCVKLCTKVVRPHHNGPVWVPTFTTVGAGLWVRAVLAVWVVRSCALTE